jgi:uncharacterized protein YbcI
MTQTHETVLADLSRAMVALHKEQFGRGPTRARSHFAGQDIVVTVLEDALLPAEKAMVAMGQSLRVQEARAFMQEATKDRFIRAVEEIVYRKVRSFQSSSDPPAGMILEMSILEPLASGDADGEA